MMPSGMMRGVGHDRDCPRPGSIMMGAAAVMMRIISHVP
jgi:hypothetical protein